MTNLEGTKVRTNRGDDAEVMIVRSDCDVTIRTSDDRWESWHPSHLWVDGNTTLRQVIDQIMEA